MCIPRFSSSWWVWLGSWDPGTLGDSCCGTCRTLAAAAAGREVEKSEKMLFVYRVRQQ